MRGPGFECCQGQRQMIIKGGLGTGTDEAAFNAYDFVPSVGVPVWTNGKYTCDGATITVSGSI